MCPQPIADCSARQQDHERTVGDDHLAQAVAGLHGHAALVATAPARYTATPTTAAATPTTGGTNQPHRPPPEPGGTPASA
jgi:hypothetical protein